MIEQAALDRVLLEMSRTLHTLVRALVDDAVAARDDASDGGRLLTVAGACQRASVGRTTLYQWIRGGLPTVSLPGRSGALTRIRVADLDAWTRGERAATAVIDLRAGVQTRRQRQGIEKRGRKTG